MLDPVTAPALFDRQECARIVATAASGDFRPGGLVGGRRSENHRRADIHWLDETGEAGWVMNRLVEAAAEANRTSFGFTLDGFDERMQVASYDGGDGGHFDWHADIGDGPLAQRRKLTIVVQLTGDDDYEGGALELNPAGHVRAASRGQGDATLFPSFILHRVTPVTQGCRHSLTVWVHGPAFR